jgi:hypothetical protein
MSARREDRIASDAKDETIINIIKEAGTDIKSALKNDENMENLLIGIISRLDVMEAEAKENKVEGKRKERKQKIKQYQVQQQKKRSTKKKKQP